MAYDAKTQRLISLKKLAGKAQTSNDKDLANEGLPSGITLASNTVFGQEISTSPSAAALYTITGYVEYLRFPVSFIAGSDTSTGRHGFELKLPSDYEANSSNTKAGTYPFIDDQVINITSGSLQVIPTSFATAYEAKPYYGGSSVKDSGTRIPILDARDWYLDCFNGIIFQQDPPGTGDHAENPDYVEAYLYIGDMLDVVVNSAGSSGGADPNAKYLVLEATGSLSAERVLTMGTGMSSSDGGAGGNFTLNVDDSVIATLTGSQFSGNIGVTGSVGATMGLSGSLTRLTDGSSYLVADHNITITSASNGQVTVMAVPSGSDNEIQFNNGGNFGASSAFTFTGTEIELHENSPTINLRRTNNNQNSDIDFKGAGGVIGARLRFSGSASNDLVLSTFTGTIVKERVRVRSNLPDIAVEVTGALKSTLGLSGSLTKLVDGSSYLVAGSGIGIASSSNGQVTITSTAQSNPLIKIYEVTASHAQSEPLIVPIDFTTNNRSMNKNQIFLNGAFMASGSALDYTLDLQSTGSIVFNMALKEDDVVIVRQS